MSIEKYLANYAEIEARELALLLDNFLESTDSACWLKGIGAFAVIPAFDEDVAAIKALLSYPTNNHSPLFILVLNSPEGELGPSYQRTIDLKDHIIQDFSLERLGEKFWLGSVSTSKDDAESHNRILLIDRCEVPNQIPKKQGVGLARKIGMDVALMINQQYANQISKDLWIHSLDADVKLPDAYFSAVWGNDANTGVAIYPIEHEAVVGNELAMAMYELTLRYYEDQLSMAGSPFAFQTVGSTIAFKPEFYAMVRGMPKRAGAEDFYFLNKLAKVTSIRKLQAPALLVSGRQSDRVPFGTGPAISKITSMGKSASDEYRYYHPKIFELLKAFLEFLYSLSAVTELPSMEMKSLLDNHLKGFDEKERAVLIAFLDQSNFDSFLAHAQKYQKKPSEFQNQCNAWFDAFLTLKFVHAMRDQLYDNVSVHELDRLLENKTAIIRQRIEKIYACLDSTR